MAVNSAPPSSNVIAQAGQRALQAVPLRALVQRAGDLEDVAVLLEGGVTLGAVPSLLVSCESPRRPRARADAVSVHVPGFVVVRSMAVSAVAYVLMGALYGYLVVYRPWTDPADATWQEAVVLGVFFAGMLGAWDAVSAWRRRRDR